MVADLVSTLSGRPKDELIGAAVRGGRTRRRLLASVIVVLLTLLGLSGWQWRAATAAGNKALARQLATQSATLAENDPELAGLLAVAAYRVSPVEQARRTVGTTALRPLKRAWLGHTSALDQISFNESGTRVLTTDDLDTALLRDAATGRTLLTTPAFGAFFVAGSEQVVTVSRNQLNLWSSDTGRVVKTFTIDAKEPTAVAADRSGRLVAASLGQQVRIWDTRSGRLLRQIKSIDEGYFFDLAWSPNGSRLATVNGDEVRLWTPGTGHLIAVLQHLDSVSVLGVSADGTELLTGDTAGRTRLWDAHDGSPITSLSLHQARVTAIALSPDGNLVASGSEDGEVTVQDIRAGRGLVLEGRHTAGVRTMMFSQDSSRLATGGDDGTARVWNVGLHGSAGLFGTNGEEPVTALSYDPESSRLVTGGASGRIRIWDAASNPPVTELAGDVLAGHDQALYSPDGNREYLGGPDGSAAAWDSTGQHVLSFLPNDDGSGISSAGSIALSPDGRRLATASVNTGVVYLWDTSTGLLLGSSEPGTGGIGPPMFGPDGRSLIALGTEGEVALLAPQTAARQQHLGKNLSSAVLSPDGRQIVTADTNGTVQLWDIATKAASTLVTSPAGPIVLAYNTSGNRLTVAGPDGRVSIWDPDNRQSLGSVRVGTAPVSRALLSPDGRRLVTSGGGSGVQLWNAETGTVLSYLTLASANTMTFSPDGSQLATSGKALVQIWDPETGQQIATLGESDSDATALEFSPDGQKLLVVGLDTAIYRSAPSGDSAVQRICASVNRDLSDSERRTYLPDDRKLTVCPKPA
ncbi:WD40 repeat domain-containing protein [Kineosporia succinea]|uniref:WD40 repeat protein n=1 Tax=Kineosporia succinea TaxID=84632 RepID=A0ABT9PBS8_9ACTN|nr:WD40 repeat protein [Kineosporia succinea]